MRKALIKKIICFGFFFIFFVLLELSSASAFGVATLYSENYPLRIKPGEVKETFFLLMNTAEGDSDVSIKSELVKGEEIAQLIDGPKDYDLPFGKEVEVPVKINIPKNMPIGTKYKIAAMFRPLPKGTTQGGDIQFIVNIGKSFPIEIVGNEEKKKGGSSITLENEPEELLGKSAPSSSNTKSIWFVIVILFLVCIIVMMLVIILIIRRKSSINNSYIGNTNLPIQQNNYAGY